MSSPRSLAIATILIVSMPLFAQEPAAWGDGDDVAGPILGDDVYFATSHRLRAARIFGGGGRP